MYYKASRGNTEYWFSRGHQISGIWEKKMFLKWFLPIYSKLTLNIDGADKCNCKQQTHFAWGPHSLTEKNSHFESAFFPFLSFSFIHSCISLQPYFSSYQISFSVAFHIALQKIKYCLEFTVHFVSFVYNFVHLENHQLSGLRVAYYEITSLRGCLQRMLGTALLKSASFKN